MAPDMEQPEDASGDAPFWKFWRRKKSGKGNFALSTLTPDALSPAAERGLINAAEQSGFDFSEALSTAPLSGHGVVLLRTRTQIYGKYQQMMASPVVSGALRLHVTAALGGHETSGDLVFIETKSSFKGNAEKEAEVTAISDALSDSFNQLAFAMAYNAAGFGDAYARLYTVKGVGVIGIAMDELLLPALVMPYEQGGVTRICNVAVGTKQYTKLTMRQIARVKMPRMIYSPQPVAVEKAWKASIEQDDPSQLPLMPSIAGGSFLADAESQYDNFIAALAGLTGQRVLDSIDESVLTVNVKGMTKEHSQKYTASLINIFKRSKTVADEQIRLGMPLMQRIRHIIPIFDEKQQLSGIQGLNSSGGSGGGRAGNISIDDVLFQAKLLCGALGIDLSMLGFADLMSGGLGEGGFFRTSAQSAERARSIRVALAECLDSIIEVHIAMKTGKVYSKEERPWQINFAGSTSALEAERQRTKLDNTNAALLTSQVFAQLKDMGMDEAAMAHFLERELSMDEVDAKMYAKALASAIKKKEQQEAAQGGFGGDGGGFGGDEEDEPESQGKPQPVPLKA